MGESPWLYAGGRPTKAWAVYYLKRGQLQAGRLRLMCCGPWAVGLSLGSCRRSSSLMGGLLGCLRGVLPTQLGRSSYLIGGPSQLPTGVQLLSVGSYYRGVSYQVSRGYTPSRAWAAIGGSLSSYFKLLFYLKEVSSLFIYNQYTFRLVSIYSNISFLYYYYYSFIQNSFKSTQS